MIDTTPSTNQSMMPLMTTIRQALMTSTTLSLVVTNMTISMKANTKVGMMMMDIRRRDMRSMREKTGSLESPDIRSISQIDTRRANTRESRELQERIERTERGIQANTSIMRGRKRSTQESRGGSIVMRRRTSLIMT